MSFTQKTIHDTHTFITMLTQLNQKINIEAKKTTYVLPAGTIIIFPVNDIDKLEIIFPSTDKDEEEIRTFEQMDNDIQQLFENTFPPKRRRGRPRKNKDLIDKAIEIFDSESKAFNHPVYDV
jgi:hypothetical protein